MERKLLKVKRFVRKLLYFLTLFTSSGVEDLSHCLRGTVNKISYEQNTVLLSPFTSEEIQRVLKGMRPTKALGPDGFPALFFQKYWHIVGKDVESFYLVILNSDQNLTSLNMTNTVLIPKVFSQLNWLVSSL